MLFVSVSLMRNQILRFISVMMIFALVSCNCNQCGEPPEPLTQVAFEFVDRTSGLNLYTRPVSNPDYNKDSLFVYDRFFQSLQVDAQEDVSATASTYVFAFKFTTSNDALNTSVCTTYYLKFNMQDMDTCEICHRWYSNKCGLAQTEIQSISYNGNNISQTNGVYIIQK